MRKFTKHTGVVATIDRANVDTDQIIPKQFLKRIERTGFGEFLFYDWRYLDDGSDNPDFELNRPEYAGARRGNALWNRRIPHLCVTIAWRVCSVSTCTSVKA